MASGMSYSTSKLPSGLSVRTPGQPETLGLVAHVHPVLGVVDRVEPDHPLVDVGPGVVHAVVVEPEEGLLLAVVATGGPVQVEVVDPFAGQVALTLGAEVHGVVRVAVALGRGVPVVQVGEEGPVGRAEVLPVQAERVLVQVVLEADEDRLAVLGVDHRAREDPVEAVDGAFGQLPLGAHGVPLAGGVEGDRRLAERVDRQDLGRGERVGRDLELDLVDDRVRGVHVARPLLVPLVAQRVLLTLAGTGDVRPVGDLQHLLRRERLRDRQRVDERRQDQRTGRELLLVEQQVAQRRRGRRKGAVGREQTLLGQVRRTELPRRGERHAGGADRSEPEDRAPRHPVVGGFVVVDQFRVRRLVKKHAHPPWVTRRVTERPHDV